MNTIAPLQPLAPAPLDTTLPARPESGALRETFDQFVGEVFFGQMLKSLRTTVGDAPYFHGGQAEKIFTQQLDQVLAEKLTTASAAEFTGPMFELFQLGRPR